MSVNNVTKESQARFEKWKTAAIKMEEWFNGRPLPEEPVQINACAKIINVKKYVETNIATMKANQERPWQAAFKPAYLRLYELKKFIESGKS